MGRSTTLVIALVALLIGAAAALSVAIYQKNNSPAPASVVELTQPPNQISPKYIAIVDPSARTVSIVVVGLQDKIEAHVMSVVPYSKTSK